MPSLLAQKLKRPVVTGDPVVVVDQHQPPPRGDETDEDAVGTGASESSAAVGTDASERTKYVEVRTLQGRLYRCRHVVVALPPALCGRIWFTNPTLPSARHQLHMHMPMGTVAKAVLLYRRRFWLEQGRSGTIFFSDEGVATAFYDASEGVGGGAQGKGKIIALITGIKHDRFVKVGGKEAQARALVQELASYLGPDALTPLAVEVYDWPANMCVQGAYSGYMTPYGWSRFGHALVAPHGKVHWAGTETAEKWMGYFEGAIEAGERAAAEVIVAQRAGSSL